MLHDLEKRNAFLNENQDQVLDGLSSAYDLELSEEYISPVTYVIIFSLIIGVFIYVYSLLEYDISNTITLKEKTQTNVNLPEKSLFKPSSINENENNLTVKKEIEQENNISLFQLDTNISIEKSSSNTILKTKSNRIDSIHFETDISGISLLMRMPDEIDYLVYGLNNPDRTVIEVENVELGFRLEDLIPVEPIVAIRYSINDEKKFKLVLESRLPLKIKKSITSKYENNHDLLVMMEYQQQQKEIIKQDDIELAEIVEKQVEQEKGIIFKGDLVKTLVNKSSDAYAEQLFQKAYNLYQKGNISESLKKLNMSLNQDAGHINARSTLALILSEQDNIELAYSVLNEGLIQYPENTEWIKMYARLLLNEGKYLEASSMLEKQQPEFVMNTEYYALQAAILQKLSGFEDSAKIYRNLLQVNPLKGVWWMGLGISLESMKRYDDALYAYQKAFSNASVAKDSREFLSHRINRLSNLLEDEST